jgi:hypothetical protein
MKLGFIRVPVATYLEPIHFPKYWGFKKKKKNQNNIRMWQLLYYFPKH